MLLAAAGLLGDFHAAVAAVAACGKHPRIGAGRSGGRRRFSRRAVGGRVGRGRTFETGGHVLQPAGVRRRRVDRVDRIEAAESQRRSRGRRKHSWRTGTWFITNWFTSRVIKLSCTIIHRKSVQSVSDI